MKDEDWLLVLCFYGTLPLGAVAAFALWSAARMAGQADDDDEVKPGEKKRNDRTNDSGGQHQRGRRQ